MSDAFQVFSYNLTKHAINIKIAVFLGLGINIMSIFTAEFIEKARGVINRNNCPVQYYEDLETGDPGKVPELIELFKSLVCEYNFTAEQIETFRRSSVPDYVEKLKKEQEIIREVIDDLETRSALNPAAFN